MMLLGIWESAAGWSAADAHTARSWDARTRRRDGHDDDQTFNFDVILWYTICVDERQYTCRMQRLLFGMRLERLFAQAFDGRADKDSAAAKLESH